MKSLRRVSSSFWDVLRGFAALGVPFLQSGRETALRRPLGAPLWTRFGAGAEIGSISGQLFMGRRPAGDGAYLLKKRGRGTLPPRVPLLISASSTLSPGTALPWQRDRWGGVRAGGSDGGSVRGVTAGVRLRLPPPPRRSRRRPVTLRRPRPSGPPPPCPSAPTPSWPSIKATPPSPAARPTR